MYKSCLNCDSPRTQDYDYCPNCGQAYREGSLSLWQIIKDFFSNTFALDGKLFTTLGSLMVPAKLTLSYVAGRKSSYIRPGRLFFIALVLHVAVLSYYMSTMLIDEVASTSDEIVRSAERTSLVKTYDSIFQSIDTIPTGRSLLIDSIRQTLFADVVNNDTGEVDLNLGDFNLVLEAVGEYNITREDLATLDADYLIEKYNITSTLDRLQIRQTIRVNTDLPGTVKSFIGNIFWLLVLMVGLSAVMLKVLYIRHSIYLSEHLVWSAHVYTFMMTVMSLVMGGLLIYCFQTDDPSYTLELFFSEGYVFYVSALLSLYPLVALYRYYRDGWIKGIIKFVVLLAGHAFLGLFVFILILVITLLIF